MSLDVTVGGENAESYVSVADSKTYHAARGNAVWANLSPSDDAPYEQLLRKATQYIDAHWRTWWKGRRADATQALAWPRDDVLDEDGATVDETTIPRAVTQATCEAALAELLTPGVLFPALERETKMERVGPIEIEYVEGADQRTQLTAVRDLLTGLLMFNGTNTQFLLRA
jgi:hypothetical protein